MTTVILDLDGTLADTARDMIAGCNAVFSARGEAPPLAWPDDSAPALRGGRSMLRLGHERARGVWTEAAIDADYPALLEHYGRAVAVHSRMYPGAVEAIEAMRGLGWRVAVCTNKPQALAEALLSALGVRGLFHALVGADTLPVKKPEAEAFRETVVRAGGDLARSVMVGDTETDHHTARAAGRPSVLVTFGPEGEGIARLAPDALLHAWADLPGIVPGLLAAPVAGR